MNVSSKMYGVGWKGGGSVWSLCWKWLLNRGDVCGLVVGSIIFHPSDGRSELVITSPDDPSEELVVNPGRLPQCMPEGLRYQQVGGANGSMLFFHMATAFWSISSAYLCVFFRDLSTSFKALVRVVASPF